MSVELIERGTLSAPVTDEAFRALNPFVLVPVIEGRGLTLAESNTILRYLARRQGRVDLLPAEPRAAALVERWIDWQATDFNEAWRYAFIATFRDAPGYDDPARIAQSRLAFDQKLSVVERQLCQTKGPALSDERLRRRRELHPRRHSDRPVDPSLAGVWRTPNAVSMCDALLRRAVRSSALLAVRRA